MPISGIWLAVPLLIVIAGIVIARVASVWLRYRGDRLITCPENTRPAGVKVDAGHAAVSSLLHPAELRLSTCSRWPERAGCGQECLTQIAEAPEGCLVRNILTQWYTGKVCASCHRPFSNLKWDSAKPALILSDERTVEWRQVPVADVPDTLKTALPVCFACHMASTLVREHPELAIDRSGRSTA